MSLHRYTLRQFDAYCQVAETLSFTAAGDRLGLTPSAVSQAITELEDVLGFRLFDRTTRRVELSPAGKEFLAVAQSVLRHAALAGRAAAEVRDRRNGLVRIAAPMVIAGFMLPHAIREWRELRPDVSVRIHDVAVDNIVTVVQEGYADMAVGPDRATSEDLASQTLFNSPWVLWCSRSSPLAAKRSVRWKELRSQPLVLSGLDHEKNLAPLLQADIRIERTAPMEVVDNISTALGIAAAGLAAAISPAYVWHLARKLGLVSRSLVDPSASRSISLYRQQHRDSPPAVIEFERHLAAWFARADVRRSKN